MTLNIPTETTDSAEIMTNKIGSFLDIFISKSLEISIVLKALLLPYVE